MQAHGWWVAFLHTGTYRFRLLPSWSWPTTQSLSNLCTQPEVKGREHREGAHMVTWRAPMPVLFTLYWQEMEPPIHAPFAPRRAWEYSAGYFQGQLNPRKQRSSQRNSTGLQQILQMTIFFGRYTHRPSDIFVHSYRYRNFCKFSNERKRNKMRRKIGG